MCIIEVASFGVLLSPLVPLPPSHLLHGDGTFCLHLEEASLPEPWSSDCIFSRDPSCMWICVWAGYTPPLRTGCCVSVERKGNAHLDYRRHEGEGDAQASYRGTQ